MATNQVLTFQLGATGYGVGILCVQEIRGWSAVTPIPDSPPQVLGVLNLRGSIVPVIDLRLRFGAEDPALTPLTAIIVLSMGSGPQRRECGLVVDSVSDVIELPMDAVKPAPRLRDGLSGQYIDGVATLGDRMIILLNADLLVDDELLPANDHYEPRPAAIPASHAATA